MRNPHFSSCGERGLLFVAVHGLLIAVAFCCRAQDQGAWASVVAACRLSNCGSRALELRLSSCGVQASLLHGMWDLPGPGPEPVSPALAGGFSTTAPPGKPWVQALLGHQQHKERLRNHILISCWMIGAITVLNQKWKPTQTKTSSFRMQISQKTNEIWKRCLFCYQRTECSQT